MPKKVAIIDDETIHIEYYIDALSAKAIRAVHYKSPASCITAMDSGVMVQRELDKRYVGLSNSLPSYRPFSFGPHLLAKGQKKTCFVH